MIVDEFDRPDAETPGSSWTPVYGTYRIQGGRAISSKWVDGTFMHHASALPCVDHFAEVVVTAGYDQYVLVRTSKRTDPDPVRNHESYSFRYFEEARAWALVRSGPTEPEWQTGLAALYEAPPSLPYTLRLQARGAVVSAYVNGVLKLSVVDDKLRNAHVGIGSAASGRAIDSFRAGCLQAAPLLAKPGYDAGASRCRFHASQSRVQAAATTTEASDLLVEWQPKDGKVTKLEWYRERPMGSGEAHAKLMAGASLAPTLVPNGVTGRLDLLAQLQTPTLAGARVSAQLFTSYGLSDSLWLFSGLWLGAEAGTLTALGDVSCAP